MDKLKMHSPNLAEGNIAKLAELFPNCVTESQDEQGNLKRSIDFDLLRQELSESIVEGPQERYHLNWPGKREALLTANAPIAKTLRPCREESVDFDTTRNLFIEGDNLDALKLLQETYLGKVKMIYIDPPYNTGKDFIYNDDFSVERGVYDLQSGIKDSDGNFLIDEDRLVLNTVANGRFHSDWLSMIYARLRLARNLLTSDGVLFVSIDDNEVHNMRKVCDEVFGAENFVAQLAVQLNPRGRHLDNFVARTHESVVIFGRDVSYRTTMYGVDKEGRMVDEYDLEDEKGKYRTLGLRNRNQAFNPDTRPNLYFPLYVCPLDGRISLSKDSKFTDIVWPDAPDGTKTCWTWGREKIVAENALLIGLKQSGDWRVFRKDYLLDESGNVASTLPKSVWLDKEITNDYGRKSIKDLLGKSVMDFPKAPELIGKLVRSGASRNDIVLDFFAGSATTAHAVMQLNVEDGGNRRFIMIQLPEQCDEKSEAFKAGYRTISEISKERIRRAGLAIKEENATTTPNLDIGFRVLKIDSSNMEEVYYVPDTIAQTQLKMFTENVKSDRATEDLLFQVLIDWGVDLSLPIVREKISGNEVFFVDGNALAACFVSDEEITEDFVRLLAERQPLRVVFRDAGFKDDSVKINVEQIFKLKSPHTDIKTI